MTSTLDTFLGQPAWPEELPQHISASQVVTFERCAELWRIRYIDRKKAPPKGFLILGSADHATIEENFRRKIDSHEDMSIPDVQGLFAETIDRLTDEAGEVDWERSSQSEAKDLGVKMVTVYREKVAPRVQPIQVEQKVEIPLDAPVPLIGYVDIETENVIVERKTSARKKSVPSQDQLIQSRLYQAAKLKPVHFQITTKTKEPAVYTPDEEPGLLVSPPDDQELRRILEYAETTIRAIQAYYYTFGPEGPWPGARGRRDSTCDFCGFRAHVCRWWS